MTGPSKSTSFALRPPASTPARVLTSSPFLYCNGDLDEALRSHSSVFANAWIGNFSWFGGATDRAASATSPTRARRARRVMEATLGMTSFDVVGLQWAYHRATWVAV
jgi:hypothetical protein